MLQSRPDSEETSTDAATASPSGRGVPTTTRVAEDPCDASLLFKRRVEANGNAANIADLAVVTWHDVLNVLSPVIGPGGVAELYKRSLHLVCADYPWLSAVYEGTRKPGDFTVLRATLTQQTRALSIEANSALLKAFYDLLSRLIGTALADRLQPSPIVKRCRHGSAQEASPCAKP